MVERRFKTDSGEVVVTVSQAGEAWTVRAKDVGTGKLVGSGKYSLGDRAIRIAQMNAQHAYGGDKLKTQMMAAIRSHHGMHEFHIATAHRKPRR